MANVKATFTLDEISLQRLHDAAERLALSKGQVVREAIMEFHNKLGRLSDRERAHMPRIFDEMMSVIHSRSAASVDRELNELRRSRRAGGRRTLARQSDSQRSAP